ncbi:hypothetical protein [Parerythrobacter lacustris]|uniref:Uncharacterized protein n=1 Tax=Parerythrobacter lacustris TaxID=2969984 RepID=A0ABT1XPY6_9SPHN|nr:hypothetical protein [Parerythrobacter lacustris]MCR2833728.1 hypothetical protein [Parerythrobacter lacustris]
MEYAPFIVAALLAFIAYKAIAGIVKFAAIGALLIGAAYVYSQGYFA